MSNRLIFETSPYLLQHAENPVDWYPWGDEAFEKARREDKPVFLSVGYSACHWCHVMAHESFEDAATAELMNQGFVSVKVDREERPDIDAIYMDAVQALTGRGGWPMSVFLTPDAVPFYGGTYFPDKPRHGMPAFSDVLRQIADLWKTSRSDVIGAGASLEEALQRQAAWSSGASREPLDAETLDAATRVLSREFDRTHGGWGGAPKFPQPAVVEFVLRRHISTGDDRLLGMVTTTLDAMMRGGIFDQLGGGFHRYATDEMWRVPHFEKMLYDNAQLARLFLHAWQVTVAPSYRDVATQTLDYLAREMLAPDGSFYSAQDADSEGEEGRFFVWTPEQVQAAIEGRSPDPVGDAEVFSAAYGVTERGNFEGASILFAARSAAEIAGDRGLPVAGVEERLDRSRSALLAAREQRVRPGFDDKVLASWNGLALAAFAEAARVLDRDDYQAIAEKNADFVLANMRDSNGRMRHSWRCGQAKLNGYLEDYAYCAAGLLELYQTTFAPRWFVAARELADSMVEHFSDPAGGFFDTSDDHEALLVRPKGLQDGAVPSGAAVAADVLLRLAHLTDETRYADWAEIAIAQVQPLMAQAPLGFAQWLAEADFALAPPQAVAIIGDHPEALLSVVRERYRPNLVVAATPGESHADAPAILEDREPLGASAAAYLCRQFACERPVSGSEELRALLG